MTSQPASGGPINIFALGSALSAALLVLFVTCLLAALIFPTLSLAHAWVGLFTLAPMASLAAWIEGILANIAFAWLIAVVAGFTYNRIAG